MAVTCRDGKNGFVSLEKCSLVYLSWWCFFFSSEPLIWRQWTSWLTLKYMHQDILKTKHKAQSSCTTSGEARTRAPLHWFKKPWKMFNAFWEEIPTCRSHHDSQSPPKTVFYGVRESLWFHKEIPMEDFSRGEFYCYSSTSLQKKGSSIYFVALFLERRGWNWVKSPLTYGNPN